MTEYLAYAGMGIAVLSIFGTFAVMWGKFAGLIERHGTRLDNLDTGQDNIVATFERNMKEQTEALRESIARDTEQLRKNIALDNEQKERWHKDHFEHADPSKNPDAHWSTRERDELARTLSKLAEAKH